MTCHLDSNINDHFRHVLFINEFKCLCNLKVFSFLIFIFFQMSKRRSPLKEDEVKMLIEIAKSKGENFWFNSGLLAVRRR